MRFLEKIFQSLSHQVLPTACIVCGHFQKLSLCNTCLSSLETDGLLNYECCMQCGIALREPEIPSKLCTQCISQPPSFDHTLCLDRYDGILQEALHQFKYQKRIAFAVGLSRAWNHVLASQSMHMSADYLLPVPLSIQKLAARGFNQSWELARRIYCASYIQKSPYILKRHHDSSHQAGGTLVNRKTSIQGMFYIDPVHIELLKGKSVIVFDDVMTSGATLNEIARILKDNGVSRVINWVLLRTSRPS